LAFRLTLSYQYLNQLFSAGHGSTSDADNLRSRFDNRNGEMHFFDRYGISDPHSVSAARFNAAVTEFLQQPQQTSLSPPFQLPLVPPGHGPEAFGRVQTMTPLQFFQQKWQMITRHHSKLTNQAMAPSNAQRCIRMLTKHHVDIENFIANLTNDGQTEPMLISWINRQHGILLDTSTQVLILFEENLTSA
jgi:hypothetical protein